MSRVQLQSYQTPVTQDAITRARRLWNNNLQRIAIPTTPVSTPLQQTPIPHAPSLMYAPVQEEFNDYSIWMPQAW